MLPFVALLIFFNSFAVGERENELTESLAKAPYVHKQNYDWRFPRGFSENLRSLQDPEKYEDPALLAALHKLPTHSPVTGHLLKESSKRRTLKLKSTRIRHHARAKANSQKNSKLRASKSHNLKSAKNLKSLGHAHPLETFSSSAKHDGENSPIRAHSSTRPRKNPRLLPPSKAVTLLHGQPHGNKFAHAIISNMESDAGKVAEYTPLKPMLKESLRKLNRMSTSAWSRKKTAKPPLARTQNNNVDDADAICTAECDGVYNQCLSTEMNSIEDIYACQNTKKHCPSKCIQRIRGEGVETKTLNDTTSVSRRKVEDEEFLQNLAWSNCNKFFQPCVGSEPVDVDETMRNCLAVATGMCYSSVRFVLHGPEKSSAQS